MTKAELALYALAETLHKTVGELREMPTSEYQGWVAYFEEKARQQEVGKGNILAMNPEEAIERFARGKKGNV